MDAFKLMKELRVNYEQEVYYLPKETGLTLIESTTQVSTFHKAVIDPLFFPCVSYTRLITSASISLVFQDDRRISAKCRDAKVEDLWSLTSFFGYRTQTFVLAVNLLDRFLAMMRV